MNRITTRRARALSALFLGAAALVAFAMFVVLSGCGTTGQGQDVHLAGNGGELFRKLTGANAITVSERVTIYGTENPPGEQLVCHEKKGHAQQARILGDALVILGYIDDDELSRAAAWVAIYSIEHASRGYENSRFELGAREACKDIPVNSTAALRR